MANKMEKASIPVEVEKEIVTELEQIFRIVDDKPYFELKYKKFGEDYYQVGYSSFDFHNVLKWKEEYFELVKENYKETIKKLRYTELPDGLVMVDLETRQEAIKALEKQIPKKMTYNIDEKVIARSVDHYGEEIQATVCMEECAELIQAISKMIRRNDELSEEDYDHLEEEVADVLICIETLKQIYSIPDLNIEEWIERKQKRMINRMEKWKL